jgi:hypothetical protein
MNAIEPTTIRSFFRRRDTKHRLDMAALAFSIFAHFGAGGARQRRPDPRIH